MKRKYKITELLHKRFFKNDELLESLTAEYLEKHPHLKQEHVYALVKEISGLATVAFDNGRCRDSDYNKMVFAENLKEAMRRVLSDSEKESLTSGPYILYEYIQGQNSRIRRCFEDAKLPPDDPSLYQDLVVELARDRAEVVANTVLNWLPYAVRYASSSTNPSVPSPNSVENMEEDTAQPKKQTFVEMVTKKQRFASEEESIKKKSLNFQEDHEEGEQDVGFCPADDGGVLNLADQNIDHSQRNIGANEVNEENDEGKSDSKSENTQYDNEHDDDALLNPQLTQIYAWLAGLPEFIQKQILNSSPIQALIEAAEQASNIYDVKSISQSFAIVIVQLEKAIEDMQEAAEVVFNIEPEQKLVDLSLTLENDLMPVAAIIHDSAPAFGELLPDQFVQWF